MVVTINKFKIIKSLVNINEAFLLYIKNTFNKTNNSPLLFLQSHVLKVIHGLH
jgi:hypothetical protein